MITSHSLWHAFWSSSTQAAIAAADAAAEREPIEIPDAYVEEEEEEDDDDLHEEDLFLMDSSETTRNCALALCNFSSSEGFRSRVVESGVVRVCVST